MIKFIKDLPLAFIEKRKILVVSELHLGFEYELAKSGIIIPSQAEKFARIIKRVQKKVGAKKLVVIGDVKHTVPGISSKEMSEIPKFFSYFKDVLVVKGNHDAGIEKLLKIKVFSSKGFKIGKFGFFHGNSWPNKQLYECDYLFASHLHPCIEIKSKFGMKSLQRVWVKSRIDGEFVRKRFKMRKVGRLNLIILPAFNPLVGRAVLGKTELKNPLKKFLEEVEIYLLDGTFVGRMKL